MNDLDARQDIKVENRRNAARVGTLYGLGIAFLFTFALSLTFPDRYPVILIPEFVSGLVFPGLMSRVMTWMEDMRP